MAELTADELALYDRQLRVWGAEGQNRIKNAKVLLINLNGVGTEITKNLTLSGIGALEIWDDSVVREQDLSAQFFLNETDLGQTKLPRVEPRIKDMNPRVKLSINTNPINFEDVSYFEQFKLVIANELTGEKCLALNGITRQLGISLLITRTSGLFGIMFSDHILDITTYTRNKMPVSRKVGPLSKNQEIVNVTSGYDKEKQEAQEHFTVKSTYKEFNDLLDTGCLQNLTKKQKKNTSPVLAVFMALFELEITKRKVTLDSLKEQAASVQARLGLNPNTDSHSETIFKSLNAELSPVAAILGGALAQDVINWLSKKDPAINNVLILDGDVFTMPVYEL